MEVLLLLGVGVGIIEPKNALAAMEARKTKVDRNGLRVAKMEVPVGLGRESRADVGRRSQVVHFGEEPLLEDGIRIGGGGHRFLRFLRSCFLGRLGRLGCFGRILGGLLGSFLHALLQLALGDHLPGLRVELELGQIIRDCVSHGGELFARGR